MGMPEVPLGIAPRFLPLFGSGGVGDFPMRKEERAYRGGEREREKTNEWSKKWGNKQEEKQPRNNYLLKAKRNQPQRKKIIIIKKNLAGFNSNDGRCCVGQYNGTQRISTTQAPNSPSTVRFLHTIVLRPLVLQRTRTHAMVNIIFPPNAQAQVGVATPSHDGCFNQ